MIIVRVRYVRRCRRSRMCVCYYAQQRIINMYLSRVRIAYIVAKEFVNGFFNFLSDEFCETTKNHMHVMIIYI